MAPEQAQLLRNTGRAQLGRLFVVSELHHLTFFGALSNRLARRGVPLPRLAPGIATGFQTAAGTLLMTGLRVSWMAHGPIGFTVVASWLLLVSWSMLGEARAAAIDQLLTNFAVIGGLLYATLATA